MRWMDDGAQTEHRRQLGDAKSKLRPSATVRPDQGHVMPPRRLCLLGKSSRVFPTPSLSSTFFLSFSFSSRGFRPACQTAPAGLHSSFNRSLSSADRIFIKCLSFPSTTPFVKITITKHNGCFHNRRGVVLPGRCSWLMAT